MRQEPLKRSGGQFEKYLGNIMEWAEPDESGKGGPKPCLVLSRVAPDRWGEATGGYPVSPYW